ncbi:uncharacterized protein TOT_040000786 [Theileria orientalis strain Shintoku]|uniref:VPS9 domain-containing protein n=1 Tax=Theileria orientalis strain Shintoku TaxID=869250 RepID=J7MF42_THEOR|nr:uncharacterized protein TOT_040000786 [Theileria orientalis strain Shintoku]BAM42419.1 uncharacterized protein TOT_040000786 [Theileria orientalis strain Shintoku]|eukprot:XP_009692720.1 uncharacterized protein TOT_040000786 [Theileria orientalis strain Shintoku]
MDEVAKNPFLCILENSFFPLYKSLFNSKSIVLLPISQSLINIDITKKFIEQHILTETSIKNNFINNKGQIVELINDTFVTSFGFNNHSVCNIIKRIKIPHGSNYIEAYLIDSHLLVSNNTELTYLQYNIEDDIEVIIQRWSKDNEEFGRFFINSLNRFKSTFVLVPGYESETSNIISNITDKSIKLLLVDKKDYSEQFKRKLVEICLNYSYHYLHDLLWGYLVKSYSTKEEIIESRISKMRNELNLNLSLLIFENRHEVSNINILPSVELLHQMEATRLPLKKLNYLEKAILINNSSSEPESISLLVLALVVGNVRNAIEHYSLMKLYLQSINENSKSLYLLESAISFLIS